MNDDVSVTTFSTVLAARLRGDASQPFLTYYDESTGERVELSLITWANWIAKASSLLADELGLEKGQRIRIDLPPHWLGTVFLGAAWHCGLVLVTDDDADVVVTGPDGLDTWAPRAGSRPVLACSLRPLGVRFSDPLPAGVHDVGVEIWGQPDAFTPWDPADPSDPAVEADGQVLAQEDVWGATAASPPNGRPQDATSRRVLTVANPASPPGFASLTEPLLSGGSLVLVTRATPARLEAIAADERVTERFE